MTHVCPAEHKHAETSTCYVHHRCRCVPCKNNRNRYERTRRYYEGVDVWVPAAPTARRLQALACIGWSAQKIGERSGHTLQQLSVIRSGTQNEVKSSTARAIAKVYRDLCMTPNTATGARRVKTVARNNKWKSPLEWVDIEKGVLG